MNLLISLLVVGVIALCNGQDSSTAKPAPSSTSKANSDDGSKPASYTNYETQPDGSRLPSHPSSQRSPNVQFSSHDSRAGSRRQQPQPAERPATSPRGIHSQNPTGRSVDQSSHRSASQFPSAPSNQPRSSTDFGVRPGNELPSSDQPLSRSNEFRPYSASQPSYQPQPAYGSDDPDYRYRTGSTQPRRISPRDDSRSSYIPDDISYRPYSFNYISDAEDSTYSHQQSADGTGKVIGSYSFVLDDGRRRVVEYIADQNGFRANIDSNEPGMNFQETPADVVYYSGAGSSTGRSFGSDRFNANRGDTQSGTRYNEDASRSRVPGTPAPARGSRIPSLTVYRGTGGDGSHQSRPGIGNQPVGGIRRPLYGNTAVGFRAAQPLDGDSDVDFNPDDVDDAQEPRDAQDHRGPARDNRSSRDFRPDVGGFGGDPASGASTPNFRDISRRMDVDNNQNNEGPHDSRGSPRRFDQGLRRDVTDTRGFQNPSDRSNSRDFRPDVGQFGGDSASGASVPHFRDGSRRMDVDNNQNNEGPDDIRGSPRRFDQGLRRDVPGGRGFQDTSATGPAMSSFLGSRSSFDARPSHGYDDSRARGVGGNTVNEMPQNARGNVDAFSAGNDENMFGARDMGVGGIGYFNEPALPTHSDSRSPLNIPSVVTHRSGDASYSYSW